MSYLAKLEVMERTQVWITWAMLYGSCYYLSVQQFLQAEKLIPVESLVKSPYMNMSEIQEWKIVSLLQQ